MRQRRSRGSARTEYAPPTRGPEESEKEMEDEIGRRRRPVATTKDLEGTRSPEGRVRRRW
jgi:hypothetical protein